MVSTARRGAASSAAARPRLGGPAAAAAAVAPRKRLASAEAESKASSAPQAKRQAASAGSSTALSLIESAHLKPLGRAQPAQASTGAAPTLAAKARSAPARCGSGATASAPARRSAARGRRDDGQCPRGESPGLVLRTSTTRDSHAAAPRFPAPLRGARPRRRRSSTSIPIRTRPADSSTPSGIASRFASARRRFSRRSCGRNSP